MNIQNGAKLTEYLRAFDIIHHCYKEHGLGWRRCIHWFYFMIICIVDLSCHCLFIELRALLSSLVDL